MSPKWIISTCKIMLLGLLLVACAAPSPKVPVMKPTQPPTSTPAPTQPLPETGKPTPTLTARNCSDLPLSEAVIVHTWDDLNLPPRLAAIDPTNGEAVCHFPIPQMSGDRVTKISPSDQYLASIEFAYNNGISKEIEFTNLDSGETFSIPYSIESWVNSIAFSPDSSHLAFAFASGSPSQGTSQSYKLVILDVIQRSVLSETQLDFNPRFLRFTDDGAEIIAVGGPEYTLSESQDSSLFHPEAKGMVMGIRDLNANRWQMPLTGILDGSIASTSDPNNGYMMTLYQSAILLSPDRNLLYIVHATENRLTSVDLQNKSVKTVDIQAQQSLIERLLSLGAGVAEAKAMNSTFKDAVISPDGKTIYVLSQSESFSEDGQHSQASHGLQVVQAQTGREMGRMDTQATRMALSPDGQQLYLGAYSDTGSWSEVVSAADLKTITRFDGELLIPMVRENGKQVLFAGKQEGGSTRMTLLDPASLQPSGSWEWTGMTLDLILAGWP